MESKRRRALSRRKWKSGGRRVGSRRVKRKKGAVGGRIRGGCRIRGSKR